MVRLAIAVGAIVLALSSCDWMQGRKAPPPKDVAKARAERIKKACASELTYARLKEYVFDQAARIRNSDPRRLDSLAAYSVVRMEDPVVKGRDDDLNVIVCSGRFVLNLPPGVEDAFNGKPVIAADVEYAAQAAADGSGLVYSMNGAEPIIYRIATLGLPGQELPQVAAAAPATEAQLPVQSPEPAPGPAARPSSAPGRTAEPPAPKVARPAERKPPVEIRPAQVARSDGAAPSFNCRRARSRSERMVCANGSLAAADRRMSAVFYDEMSRADPATKSALRRTRDRFLARRERCSTDACVAQVYADRTAEIRRIARH